ncbi:hypothetical protein RND71_025880 [Anisodus tanguticus]|uniref:DUF4378 domain-containing protein n=1 Tax=Anisodus tanguticus TaxID=243964 RepID=A0AAE1RL81_9SOLA|nr:hypothetical protein RND71_025880 [Anisodus tanguticus]
MEEKQHTQSVIARLMGLDELPPQPPLSVKKRKVLSENYLQKTASIGLREKSSFSVSLSRGINTQKHQVVKDAPGVEMPDIYSQNAAKLKMQKYTDSSFTSMKEKYSYFKDSESTSESLRSTKKLSDLHASKPYCLPVHSDIAKPIGKMSARTTTEKNTSRTLKDDVGQCSIHHLKKINFQFGPNANMPHPYTRIIVVKPSSGKYRNTKVLNPPSSKKFSTKREDDALNSFSKRSSFSQESKKQITERWKPTNDLEEIEIARRSRSPGEILATDVLETRPQFSDSKGGKHSESMKQKQKDNAEYRDLNLKETEQHSPNSVLEPSFREEKPCTSAFHGLYSVAVQLHFLETSSEETYSEGSEMDVSSDGDSKRGSPDLLQINENILKDSKTAEGRDFSYLVDVLDEAVLHGMNLGMCFETWHSLEYPVDPSVFDLLENKYGKQTSWLKSERKLLFDHINSGLSEIFHSILDIYIMKKSLKRRCCSTMRRIDIEEELWRMLVSQENEVRKDLSGKAIGNETKWLQVDEEIGSICRDIEVYLFDELVAELALH